MRIIAFTKKLCRSVGKIALKDARLAFITGANVSAPNATRRSLAESVRDAKVAMQKSGSVGAFLTLNQSLQKLTDFSNGRTLSKDTRFTGISLKRFYFRRKR